MASKNSSPTKSGTKLSLFERSALLFVGEVICLALALVAALGIWVEVYGFGAREFTMDFLIQNIYLIGLIVPWLLLSTISNSYSLKHIYNLQSSFKQPVQATLVVGVIYALVYFFAPRKLLPRAVVIFFTGISCVFILLWRLFFYFLFCRNQLQHQVIVLGEGEAVEETRKLLEESLYYQVMDVMPFSKLETLLEDDLFSDQIIYSDLRPLTPQSLEILLKLRKKGIVILSLTECYEELTGRTPLFPETTGNPTFFALGKAERELFYRSVKRLIDIVFSVLGILCLAPFFPFLVLAIKWDSKGPIFYSQMRIGKNGQPFRLWKLRTMKEGAQGAMWTEDDDNRLTGVGKYLRKVRIDELPQLWNVLKGDMSLVGVRPLSAEQCQEFAQLIPYHNLRHLSQPGITSWAIINFRHVNDHQGVRRRLEYDLYYAKHQSLWLDFYIVLRTIWIIVTLKGK